MAQVFTLTLTDNVETVDFVGSEYRVADGGFDISLPRVRRELAPQRPGFYVPSIEYFEYRESTLEFEIRGTTRANILTSIQKIERILRNISLRTRVTAGRRGELRYAWDGATNLTYFEVYGGDFQYPDDVLSLEKMHMVLDSKYIVTELRLTLFLSAYGYGLSLFSDPTFEVPLYNTSVGAKQIGGVNITGPGNDSRYNYVRIAAADLPGSQPYITKIQLASSSPYTAFDSLYIGHQVDPQPTKLVFDDYDEEHGALSTVNDANANPDATGTYNTHSGAASLTYYTPTVLAYWGVTNTTVGMFYAFLHTWNYGGMDITKWVLSAGLSDVVRYGLYYKNDFVMSTRRTVPLGPLQIPPSDISLKDYGTIHPDLSLTLWGATTNSVGTPFYFDMLTLLPMGNGLRVWRARELTTTGLTGTHIDDGWRGLTYVKSGSNVWTAWYGIMEPLKLEANLNQNLYFISNGLNGQLDDRARTFTVRIWAVPTYLSLAT